MIGAVAFAFGPAVVGVFEDNDVLRFVSHDEPCKWIGVPPRVVAAARGGTQL
jgi:hypothetical protein